MTTSQQTHEAFLHAVRRLAVARHTLTDPERAKLESAKLVYGAGERNGTRGVCYYEAWEGKPSERHPFVEVCASGEESVTQLAGTTLHELAHVLAGAKSGHGPAWKLEASRLGLRHAIAAGQHYVPADFAQDIRFALFYLSIPTDGRPALSTGLSFFGLPITRRTNPAACPLGIGTRGGVSRGAGSGSRLLKVVCPSGCGYNVRVTRKWLTVGAPICPTDNVPMVEVVIN